MQFPKRSTDEVIVLSLCALCMLGLLLFLVIRLQRADYAVAFLDGLGFLVSLAIFAYVYRTHDLRIAGPALGLASLIGSVALVALLGADERYLLYPTTVVAFFLMPPMMALTVTVLALVATSVFIFPSLEIFVFGKFLLSVGGCLLFAYIFARERNSQRDELISLSTIDALTGVGNRRAFDAQMLEVMRVQERSPAPVSLLLIDMDNFKQVNDEKGHDRGDRLLKEVAGIISGRMRAGDHAFRFGGDEFAILAKGEGVEKLAQDLCERVTLLAEGQRLPVSLSVGLAHLGEADSVEAWLKSADQALYGAKAKGRNRVEIAS